MVVGTNEVEVEVEVDDPINSKMTKLHDGNTKMWQCVECEYS